MGAAVERDTFADHEYDAFSARLRECLAVFATTLERPGFGVGPASIGAEVEGSIVDAEGRVSAASRDVQADLADPRVVSELARFNIEANLAATPAGGLALAALEAELREVHAAIDAGAQARGGRLVTAGIVPSIAAADVGPDAVTDEMRYHALENGLRRLRGTPIQLDIDGPEPLAMTVGSVAVEGASTSWQLHLRVDPQRFRVTYNAAQLATVVVLAAAGNAPFYCGHRLWQETRVALFQQAIDRRAGATAPFSRVGLGQDWLRGGAYELVAAAVRHHSPIIPVLSDLPPDEDVVEGGAPALAELRLHLGTVWSWNRPVYDPVGGGHLRLELRALPSGPTPVDMLANAAFLLGLTLALADTADDLVAVLAFPDVQRGFAEAARRGLDAELSWVDEYGEPRRVHARSLAEELLPVAQAGLDAAGFDAADSAARLGVIAERLRVGRTGAVWLTGRATEHEVEHDRAEALRRTTLDYAARSAEGAPVHTWAVRP